MGRSSKDTTLQKITKIYVYCHIGNFKFKADGYETPVTLTRNIDNSKENNNNNKIIIIIKHSTFFRLDLNRGRQHGKQEALPLHHGSCQFSKSNTIFKYSVVQRGPTKLIMEEYFCRSNYTYSILTKDGFPRRKFLLNDLNVCDCSAMYANIFSRFFDNKTQSINQNQFG